MPERKTYRSMLDIVGNWPGIIGARNSINKGESVSIRNIKGSLKSILVYAIHQKTDKKILIIAPDKDTAEEYTFDFGALGKEESIALLYKPKKFVRFRDGSENGDISWIISGITRLSSSDNIIAIAEPDIFDFKLPDNTLSDKYSLLLKKNEAFSFTELTKSLFLNGFERKDYVEKKGDIAVRGGIIDIFPVEYDSPVRIEFWGDTIESIRDFDPLSQRSIKEYPEIKFISKIYHDESESCSTIHDYIKDNFLIVFDTPDVLDTEILSNHVITSIPKLFINPIGETDVEFVSNSPLLPKTRIKDFVELLIEYYRNNFNIYITAEGEGALFRLRDIVESNLEDKVADYDDILSAINWLSDGLSEGFILKNEKLVLFTEHQIFARLRTRNRKKISKDGLTLKQLKDLQIGDYVVHEDKGIGKFDGFETVKFGGSLQDCIRLIYADGDVLYVHLNYIHKIQQYQASEGVMPKINKLGSAEWLRKKLRTKKKIKDIARNLIKLYAQRKAQKGYAFPSDTVWQKEFEASFIYEDTPDQARTTDEVKADMESIAPMDRLVCGDVGFGKTEIAIRAAFKAVQEGKQTSVLVPTTILAQQHYMTFKDRLNNFPVNIEVISRFKGKKAQNEVIDKLKSGGIDILIGTHRLLSKDVQFKDLGCLIIDEEHRFGVSAKEKLRELKVSVDTLTLTATPIPRTLNFSLMGARDLSIIETPPNNRVPVITEIIMDDDEIIKSAVENELKRKGQIFFVNDRIEGLDKIASNLSKLLPFAKIGMAHGRMKANELEKVMEKFIEGRYDILVTTKIIESGLDIPNANTIIINRADNFGLAELYQLRGRVGRSNIQAYCYLTVPPLNLVSRKALQRLQAIEEFTDLGSGFQLAMRDLEIRGAGNLLGAEQSGFINEIGFELYHKILDEAVRELKYDEFPDIFETDLTKVPEALENNDVAIEIDTDAFIPDTYIKSNTDRFSYYKKFYNISERSELESLLEELTDKYGKLPPELVELTFVVKLRIAALNTAFQRIIVRKNSLTAEFPIAENSDYYDNIFPFVNEIISEIPGAKIIQQGKKLFLELSIKDRDNAVESLWRIKKHLELL